MSVLLSLQEWITGLGWPLLSAAAVAGAVAYTVWWVFWGLGQSVYLVSQDTGHPEQRLINVANGARRREWVRTLRSRTWTDDVDLVLMDYDRRGFQFRIRYGLWRRYTLEAVVQQGETRLNGRLLRPGRRYGLRSGMRLRTGGRYYDVVVTARFGFDLRM